MIEGSHKILITGCGGMLGEAVYSLFKDRGVVLATDIDVNESWLSYLDVGDRSAVDSLCDYFQPDYILNLAAKTDLEYCEKNPEEAFRTNAWGAYNTLWQSRKRGIPFVHISTAGIFNGEKDFYDEEDAPDPLSIYGKSKYLGELMAVNYKKSIVVRPGWMMGGGKKKDKKFVNKIIKQLCRGDLEIFAVNDKLGTPTYTHDLAKIIYYLLDNQIYGLFHSVCEGGCSRWEVADFIVKSLGFKDKVHVISVGSDYFKGDYFAPRPFSEKLVNKRLNQLAQKLTRSWQECLEEYLSNYYENYFGQR